MVPVADQTTSVRVLASLVTALYRDGMSNRELARKLTEFRIPTARLLSPGPKTGNGLTRISRTRSNRRVRSPVLSGEWSPTQVARLLQQIGPLRQSKKREWEADGKRLFNQLVFYAFPDDAEVLRAFRSEIDREGEPVIPEHLWDFEYLWMYRLPRKTLSGLFGRRC